MAEWSIAPVLKTGSLQGLTGSNPVLSVLTFHFLLHPCYDKLSGISSYDVSGF